MIQKQSSKKRTDAYFQRRKSLRKSAEDLHKVTGAHMSLQIIPTWKKGTPVSLKTPGFPPETVQTVQGEQEVPHQAAAPSPHSPVQRRVALPDEAPQLPDQTVSCEQKSIPNLPHYLPYRCWHDGPTEFIVSPLCNPIMPLLDTRSLLWIIVWVHIIRMCCFV